jgi:hypothetical protein
MINKINKERRRSMNTTPTRPSNKNQWQGAMADPTKTIKIKPKKSEIKVIIPVFLHSLPMNNGNFHN